MSRLLDIDGIQVEIYSGETRNFRDFCLEHQKHRMERCFGNVGHIPIDVSITKEPFQPDSVGLTDIGEPSHSKFYEFLICTDCVVGFDIGDEVIL